MQLELDCTGGEGGAEAGRVIGYYYQEGAPKVIGYYHYPEYKPLSGKNN